DTQSQLLDKVPDAHPTENGLLVFELEAGHGRHRLLTMKLVNPAGLDPKAFLHPLAKGIVRFRLRPSVRHLHRRGLVRMRLTRSWLKLPSPGESKRTRDGASRTREDAFDQPAARHFHDPHWARRLFGPGRFRHCRSRHSRCSWFSAIPTDGEFSLPAG